MSQAALEKEKISESVEHEDVKVEEEKAVESLTSQINELAVRTNPAEGIVPADSTEGANVGVSGQDIDKKIRALKKKVHVFIQRPALECCFDLYLCSKFRERNISTVY